jgi:phosphatidylinositol alpha-mannosyltransferase
LETLIRAFHHFYRQYPNARLIVAGDGFLKPYYKWLARGLPKEAIDFVGRIDKERPDYYASADVFCFPCQKAAFSVTILEAMAAKKGIIASDMHAFRQVLTDGESASLVDPYDPESLAQALLHLAQNRKKIGDMGEKAFKLVHDYSWQSIVDRVETYYCELRAGFATEAA